MSMIDTTDKTKTYVERLAKVLAGEQTFFANSGSDESKAFLKILNGSLAESASGDTLGYITPNEYCFIPKGFDIETKGGLVELNEEDLTAFVFANMEVFKGSTHAIDLAAIRTLFIALGLLDTKDDHHIKEWVHHKDDAATLNEAQKAKIPDVKNALLKYAASAGIIVAFSALLFFTTGHHYTNQIDDAFSRFLSIAGAEATYAGIKRSELLHTAIHPFGIRRPYLMLLQMRLSGKLHSQIRVKLEAMPAGMALLGVTQAILRYTESHKHGKLAHDLQSGNIAQINEMYDRVKKNPLPYHVNARLYGEINIQIPYITDICRQTLPVHAAIVYSITSDNSLLKSFALLKVIDMKSVKAMATKIRDENEKAMDKFSVSKLIVHYAKAITEKEVEDLSKTEEVKDDKPAPK